MSLYEDWFRMAYEKDGKFVSKVWNIYLPQEQKIYESMLSEKWESIDGTVKELAERFDMQIEFICGFLDGIGEASESNYDIKEITPDSEVHIKLDYARLYKKMVEYKATHLHDLPQWDNIFPEKERNRLYAEQKSSTTFVRSAAKIGRNDPCPCGSGKKYKQCCAKKSEVA
jgi:hypothetical protein